MTTVRLKEGRQYWEEVPGELVGDGGVRVWRPAEGVATQVLYSGQGLALAAVQVISDHKTGMTVMYERADPSDKPDLFRSHVLFNVDKEPFSFILTNFSHKHQLFMPILRTDPVGEKNGSLINSVNVVPPDSCVKITADASFKSRRLIFESIGSANGGISVKQDEADAKQQKRAPEGLYVFVTVQAPSDAADLLPLFDKTKWVTEIDYVVVPQPPPPPPPPAPVRQFDRTSFPGRQDAGGFFPANPDIWWNNNNNGGRGGGGDSIVVNGGFGWGTAFGSPSRQTRSLMDQLQRPEDNGPTFSFSSRSSSSSSSSAPAGAAMGSFGIGSLGMLSSSQSHQSHQSHPPPDLAATAAGPISLSSNNQSRPIFAAAAAAAAGSGGDNERLEVARERLGSNILSVLSSGERLECLRERDDGAPSQPPPPPPLMLFNRDAKQELIMESRAGQIKHGDVVDESGHACLTMFDATKPAQRCVIGLSVQTGLVFAGLSPIDPEQVQLAVMAVKHDFVHLLQVRTKYVEAACVICLDDRPDTVFYPCTHQCCHFSCIKDLGPEKKCPLCRAPVRACVKPSNPIVPHPKPERRALLTVPMATIDKERALWKAQLEVLRTKVTNFERKHDTAQHNSGKQLRTALDMINTAKASLQSQVNTLNNHAVALAPLVIASAARDVESVSVEDKILCHKLHRMTRYTHRPINYNGEYTCDVCNASKHNFQLAFYHCDTCRNYDLCPPCADRAKRA